MIYEHWKGNWRSVQSESLVSGVASWIWDVSAALKHVCDGHKQLVSLNTIVLKNIIEQLFVEGEVNIIQQY